MKALVCEMCGSNDIIKQDGLYVCQHCNTKYSVEDAKKMMVEGTINITGTVKIDTKQKTDNLYILARRARKEGNDENARKYYMELVRYFPNDWESAFYSVYYQTKLASIAQFECSVNNIVSAFKTAYKLVGSSRLSLEEQKEKQADMSRESLDVLRALGDKERTDWLNQKSNSTLDSMNSSVQHTKKRRLLGDACIQIGNVVYSNESADDEKAASEIYKAAVELYDVVVTGIKLDSTTISRIKNVDPGFGYMTPGKIFLIALICIVVIIVFVSIT